MSFMCLMSELPTTTLKSGDWQSEAASGDKINSFKCFSIQNWIYGLYIEHDLQVKRCVVKVNLIIILAVWHK